MTLAEWGWNDRWAEAFRLAASDPAVPARVVGQHRDRWTVQLDSGEATARIPSADRPDLVAAVGDWIAVAPGPMPADPWSIVAVLPRRTAFSRSDAGDSSMEQVLAANVDRVWVAQPLDRPINPRAIERYLAVAWESGANPEVVLTKADAAPDAEAAAALARSVAVGLPVWVVTMAEPESVEPLRSSLAAGQTIVLLGSSGAGKSTLINHLADETLARTGAVRESDHKGRHTTTHRALYRIASGALLLDTPGLRELGLWDVEEGIDRAFPEIDELASHCRYRDCRHESEPGCAVKAAVETGIIDPARLASYRKLLAESAHQLRKIDPLARAAAVAQHKTAMKTLKHHPKYRQDG